MPGFDGLHVDHPSGKRWELALELLLSGEGAVSLDGVILQRLVHGPTATGRIGMDIVSSTAPEFLTATAAAADIEAGMSVVETAARADQRFAALIVECGVERTYIFDYGMGSVKLAAISEEGTPSWQGGWEPNGAT